MGSDKAALRFGGTTALERAHSLVAARAARAFVSVGTGQRDDALRSRFARIEDRHGGRGPADGILSAQREHGRAAWLVVACDLPRLDANTLDHLLAHRAADRHATAYRSVRDDLPEPLCAVYEPSSRRLFEAAMAAGVACPRKILMDADVLLLDQPCPGALDNVNTPDELARAVAARERTYDIEYFAYFRERAGIARETVRVAAETPSELFAALGERHAGLRPLRNMKVAINDEIAGLDDRLADGDRVLFFPPVAGG